MLEWEQRVNQEGRVVYALRLPEKYSFDLSGIVDYVLAKPRFKAINKFPDVEVQWFYDLQPAKEYLITKITLWLLDR